MKPFHCFTVLLVVFTLLSELNLLQGRVVHQRDTNGKMKVNCGTKMREDKCSTFSPAWNYSLKLSSLKYSPRQEIQVKVFMTHCPSIDLPGPRWYQLEILTNTDSPQPTSTTAIGSKSVGEFYVQGSHTHFCTHRTRVLFASCDPKSFDLPGNYLWIAPNTPSGEICFRLTVQEGETEESSCEEKVMCIQPTESESSGQEFGDDLPESGSGNYDYSEDDSEASHSKSEQYSTLTDAAEEANKESTDLQEISSNSATVTATCEEERDFFLSYDYKWIPHCNCHGFYSPVQCWVQEGQLECWCSTRNGLSIANTRRTFDCTNPEEFDFDCTGAS